MTIAVGQTILCEAHPVPCKIGAILPQSKGEPNIYVEYDFWGKKLFDWLHIWEIQQVV